MRKRLTTIIIAITMAATGLAATNNGDNNIKQWKAGSTVSLATVKQTGIDKCFMATPISDETFKRIYGKTYPKDCTVARGDLRYVRVLHYTGDGKIKLGEIICHKSIAHDLTDIFRQLFEAKYPIESIRLIDDYGANDEASMNANNTSCFNFRFVAGTRKMSNHSRGTAIDINPLYNPYVKRRSDGTLRVNPEAGRKYANRKGTFPYKIDSSDLCYKLFTKHGFAWGGNWRTLKDYQHFEKR